MCTVEKKRASAASNSYEGGKEKGLYEGHGKATYVGGHTYTVRRCLMVFFYFHSPVHRVIGVEI